MQYTDNVNIDVCLNKSDFYPLNVNNHAMNEVRSWGSFPELILGLLKRRLNEGNLILKPP